MEKIIGIEVMTSKKQAEKLAEAAVTRLNGAPVRILEKDLLEVIPLAELLEVAKAAAMITDNYSSESTMIIRLRNLSDRVDDLRATGKVEL